MHKTWLIICKNSDIFDISFCLYRKGLTNNKFYSLIIQIIYVYVDLALLRDLRLKTFSCQGECIYGI